MALKNITIFGSTGSIGESALRVVKAFPDRFKVYSMAAQSSFELLKKRMLEFSPAYVSLAEEKALAKLQGFIGRSKKPVRALDSRSFLANEDIFTKTDIFIMAVVGFAGLESTLKAVKTGRRVALANKEALVAAGDIVMASAKKHGSEIFPVDSEHSAVFQCLKKENAKSVKHIILTASGGPFYNKSKSSLAGIKPEEAVRHPNWKMGRKISVDSATLMNKGLEVIEAHHLFGVPIDKIKILIHPQSIVHSMVEFADGSVLAQMSKTDMVLPITYALSYPERFRSRERGLDLAEIGKLEFREPDFGKFPCLKLALECAKKGGVFPLVLNAANECAVNKFLRGEIKFTDIPKLIEKTLVRVKRNFTPSIEDVYNLDGWARTLTERMRI